MANIYNVTMKRFNGVDFDTIIPAGGQESEFFEATYGSTTYAELSQEYSNNKKIYYVDSLSGIYFYLYKTETDSLSNRVFYFRGLNGEETKCSTSGWTVTKNNTQSYDNKLFLLENTVEGHTSAISDIEDDVDDLNNKVDGMFSIGDEKKTLQNDLGDKWLLCNKDRYLSSDYPELSELLGQEATIKEISDRFTCTPSFGEFYYMYNDSSPFSVEDVGAIGQFGSNETTWTPCFILNSTKTICYFNDSLNVDQINGITKVPGTDIYKILVTFLDDDDDERLKILTIPRNRLIYTSDIQILALQIDQSAITDEIILPTNTFWSASGYGVLVKSFLYWGGTYWLSVESSDEEGTKVSTGIISKGSLQNDWTIVLKQDYAVQGPLYICENQLILIGNRRIGILSSPSSVTFDFKSTGSFGRIEHASMNKINNNYFLGNTEIENLFGSNPLVTQHTTFDGRYVTNMFCFEGTNKYFVVVGTSTTSTEVYSQNKEEYPVINFSEGWVLEEEFYSYDSNKIDDSFIWDNGKMFILSYLEDMNGMRWNYRELWEASFVVPEISDENFYVYIKALN